VWAGHTVVFAAAAASRSASRVQWQISVDGGQTFANLPHATSPQLKLIALAGYDGELFRAVFSTRGARSVTSVASLKVNYVTIHQQPAGQTVNAGDTATFTVAADLRPSGYVQWQMSTAGGPFLDLAGANSPTLKIMATASEHGDRFRAVFITSAGTTYSTAATLLVRFAPVVVTDPVDQAVAVGEFASFYAAAVAYPVASVRWQVSIQGGPFTDIPGATATQYLLRASTTLDSRQYRAVFTNSLGSTATQPAVLHVGYSPWITLEPTTRAALAGFAVWFTAAAYGTPAPSVQWQVSSDGVHFVDINGATSPTLTFTARPLDNRRQYRAVFTNPVGQSATWSATLFVLGWSP
jgi:hypothetical protein